MQIIKKYRYVIILSFLSFENLDVLNTPRYEVNQLQFKQYKQYY